ncbi:hypothetical protein ACFS27_19145 [Promicromonospora vindobonensis]|uniref:SUKH-4 immunity protein of toxin-antitoxin system n=1 Tax=Promicromonospora vindobonensis TaxID=195748 RepID=A0ABW5VZD9_9MICO
MPLPDTITHRLIQARLLLNSDRGLAMNHQVWGPATEPPTTIHPDHADVLLVANGFVLGVVRLNDGPWLPDWNPFAALPPGRDTPPGTWYVVGDVHDVDLLVLNEDDGSIWLVDGEPGGHWPDGTAYRRLADSLATFLQDFVVGHRYRELSELPDDDWAHVNTRLDELQPLVEYVRYEASTPTRRMSYPGVVALANGLAHSKRLTPEDQAWWHTHNDLLNGTYPDLTAADTPTYDRERHPDARTYFRADARDLLGIMRGYLELLDRYDVGWREVRTYDPGRILYADAVQVVAEPWGTTC